MEYYGRQMLELKDGKTVESRPGEHNQFDYLPIGTTGATVVPAIIA